MADPIMISQMKKGDNCLYMVESRCGAPAFKVSHGYRRYFSVQYLEFNTQDVNMLYEIPYEEKERASWSSNYPGKYLTSPKSGYPTRDQTFNLDTDPANWLLGINNSTIYKHVKRPIKGEYDLAMGGWHAWNAHSGDFNYSLLFPDGIEEITQVDD